METINFKVRKKEIIQIDNSRLVGLVGQDKFKVTFEDAEWEGLHKTMKLIRPDGTILYLAMVNDEVELTQNCYTDGISRIGFFGTINEDDPENMQIATTNYLPIYIYEHAYNPDSSEASNIPMPTQWDIIIGQFNDIVDEMNDIKADTVQIKEDTQEIKNDTQQIKEDTQSIKNDIVDIQTDINNKVDAFNGNVTQKTNEFNENATNKTNDFNTNAENKTDAFNSNATSKTNTFNSNVTSKTNTFNSNATSKTNTFNENATNKTTAFDDNYTEKVGEVNRIVADFKDYVETVDYNYNNLENKPQTWNALIGE